MTLSTTATLPSTIIIWSVIGYTTKTRNNSGYAKVESADVPKFTQCAKVDDKFGRQPDMPKLTQPAPILQKKSQLNNESRKATRISFAKTEQVESTLAHWVDDQI